MVDKWCLRPLLCSKKFWRAVYMSLCSLLFHSDFEGMFWALCSIVWITPKGLTCTLGKQIRQQAGHQWTEEGASETTYQPPTMLSLDFSQGSAAVIHTSTKVTPTTPCPAGRKGEQATPVRPQVFRILATHACPHPKQCRPQSVSGAGSAFLSSKYNFTCSFIYAF